MGALAALDKGMTKSSEHQHLKIKSDRQESCKFLPVAFSMHSGIIRKIHLYEFLNIPMLQTSLAHFPKPYFLLLNFRFSVYLSFALSVAEAAFLCVVHGCDGFANVVRTQSKKMSSSLLTPSMTPLK